MKIPTGFSGKKQIKCNVLRLPHEGIDEKQPQREQQANLICKTNTDRRQKIKTKSGTYIL